MGRTMQQKEKPSILRAERLMAEDYLPNKERLMAEDADYHPDWDQSQRDASAHCRWAEEMRVKLTAEKELGPEAIGKVFKWLRLDAGGSTWPPGGSIRADKSKIESLLYPSSAWKETNAKQDASTAEKKKVASLVRSWLHYHAFLCRVVAGDWSTYTDYIKYLAVMCILGLRMCELEGSVFTLKYNHSDEGAATIDARHLLMNVAKKRNKTEQEKMYERKLLLGVDPQRALDLIAHVRKRIAHDSAQLAESTLDKWASMWRGNIRVLRPIIDSFEKYYGRKFTKHQACRSIYCAILAHEEEVVAEAYVNSIKGWLDHGYDTKAADAYRAFFYDKDNMYTAQQLEAAIAAPEACESTAAGSTASSSECGDEADTENIVPVAAAQSTPSTPLKRKAEDQHEYDQSAPKLARYMNAVMTGPFSPTLRLAILQTITLEGVKRNYT